MYDSKKRPHKIVIYSKFKEGMTAIVILDITI